MLKTKINYKNVDYSTFYDFVEFSCKKGLRTKTLIITTQQIQEFLNSINKTNEKITVNDFIEHYPMVIFKHFISYAIRYFDTREAKK